MKGTDYGKKHQRMRRPSISMMGRHRRSKDRRETRLGRAKPRQSRQSINRRYRKPDKRHRRSQSSLSSISNNSWSSSQNSNNNNNRRRFPKNHWRRWNTTFWISWKKTKGLVSGIGRACDVLTGRQRIKGSQAILTEIRALKYYLSSNFLWNSFEFVLKLSCELTKAGIFFSEPLVYTG